MKSHIQKVRNVQSKLKKNIPITKEYHNDLYQFNGYFLKYWLFVS